MRTRLYRLTKKGNKVFVHKTATKAKGNYLLLELRLTEEAGMPTTTSTLYLPNEELSKQWIGKDFQSTWKVLEDWLSEGLIRCL